MKNGNKIGRILQGVAALVAFLSLYTDVFSGAADTPVFIGMLSVFLLGSIFLIGYEWNHGRKAKAVIEGLLALLFAWVFYFYIGLLAST